jgi:hypothetical protein
MALQPPPVAAACSCTPGMQHRSCNNVSCGAVRCNAMRNPTPTLPPPATAPTRPPHMLAHMLAAYMLAHMHKSAVMQHRSALMLQPFLGCGTATRSLLPNGQGSRIVLHKLARAPTGHPLAPHEHPNINQAVQQYQQTAATPMRACQLLLPQSSTAGSTFTPGQRSLTPTTPQ